MSHRHTACCLTEIVATAASRNPKCTLRLSPFKAFKEIPKWQHPQEGCPMSESSFLRGTVESRNSSPCARAAAQQAHRWPMLAAADDAQPLCLEDAPRTLCWGADGAGRCRAALCQVLLPALLAGHRGASMVPAQRLAARSVALLASLRPGL